MKIDFENARIVTMRPEAPYVRGSVCVDGERIVAIGDAPTGRTADRTVDCRGGIVMPALCNTHTHLAMTTMRNAADDLPLRDWLYRRIFPLEARLDEAIVAAGARLGLAEAIKGGTACFCDMYLYPETMARVLGESGAEGVVVCGDNDRDGDTAAHLERQERVLTIKTPHVRGMLGFHAEYTCSVKYLEGIADLAAAHAAPVAFHNSETLDEVGTCASKYDLSPTQFLHSVGLLDRGGLAAHCVCCDKDDLALLAQCGVAASVNIGSNLKLGSGVPPIASMQTRRLRITLGTDGAASNNRLDLWREMYLASVVTKGTLNTPQAAAAPDVLRWATAEGYDALGIEGGRLSVGGPATLIVVDTRGAELTPLGSPASALVYAAGRDNVRLTMCRGRILYEDGRLQNGWDEAELVAKASEARDELFRRAES